MFKTRKQKKDVIRRIKIYEKKNKESIYWLKILILNKGKK